MPQDILDFFARTRAELLRHERDTGRAGSTVAYKMNEIVDLVPHYWREEANTLEEYFIRYGRGLGLHVTADRLTGGMRFRLTRDIADEATITWPGKPST